MRVLIACEESQTECMAFRALDGIKTRKKQLPQRRQLLGWVKQAPEKVRPARASSN